MRYAVIESGVVVNVVEADEADPVPEGWVASDEAGPGWAYADSAFTAPEVAEVFLPLTRYQFVRGLRANGLYAAIRGRFLLSEIRQDKWENELYWRREDAALEEVRVGASVSEAAMDQVFRDGAAVTS